MVIGDGEDLSEIASNLFAVLRKVDDGEEYQGIKLIFCETFEQKGIGVAIMNRLEKAAQHNAMITGVDDVQNIPLQ